jgi:hypothetical protein
MMSKRVWAARRPLAQGLRVGRVRDSRLPGPAESTAPGIGARVEADLSSVFRRLGHGG